MELNAQAVEATEQGSEHFTPVATTRQSARICVLQCSVDTSSTNGHSCRDCKEIREIEASLAAAEQLVSDLKERRTALQSAIVARNDPITGILPPEISTRIFELYIEVHAKENRHYDVRELDEVSPDVPLRLGAVCRRWRVIAWSSPSLWTMLKVDLLSKGHAHGPELVQLWFERTRSLLVSVRLIERRYRRGYLNDASKLNAKSVMAVLNRFSSKLFSLDLERVPLDIASLFRNPRREFPTPTFLQYLCVGNGGDDEEEDLIGSSTDYDICLFHRYNPPPSPHSLSLHSSIPPNRINIVWTGLTTLSFENVSWSIVYKIIRLCASSLMHISLGIVTDFGQDDQNPAQVTDLPELVSLSFTNMETSEGVAEALFDNIRFPSLASLKYYGDAHEHTMPVRSMVTCIRSSACNLKELVINEPEVEHVGELVPLLREVPALKILDLSLGSTFNLDYLLREMSGRVHRRDEPKLLPALEYLELTAYPTFEWSAFTQIWLTGEPVTTKRGVSIPGIYPERKKLGARINLQDDGDDTHFLPCGDVLDIISIIPELDSDSDGISIQCTDVGTLTMDLDTPPPSISNLIEASYLHHFPTESEPRFL